MAVTEKIEEENTMTDHLRNANAAWAAAIEGAIRTAQQQPHRVAAHEIAQQAAAVEAARSLGGLASHLNRGGRK